MRTHFLSTAMCVLALTLLLPTPTHAAPVRPLVIYGEDGRIEVYQDPNEAHKILAESVVAIMPSASVKTDGVRSTGLVTLDGGNYGQDNHLCPIERFREQSAPAYCSGFLVASDIIATAGHCVEDKGFCKDARFVFGFMKDTADRDPNVVSKNDVYGCKKVLAHQMANDGSDYALVRLDRPVAGRAPLAFAKHAPATSEPVFIIGHPVGLPAKISSGANVRKNQHGYFTANIDSFEGNSGSAVFNENFEVAGILVRGEADFVPQGSCYVTHHCDDTQCDGEDATNADVVAKALDALLKSPKLASHP